jgi:Flp pilus assembly protein TadG
MLAKQQINRLDRRRRGAVAVTAAISLPFMIGFAALTIDMGFIYNMEAELQAAVDGGSIAGATALQDTLTVDGNGDSSVDSDAVTAKALAYAGKNFAGAKQVIIDSGGIEVGYIADLSNIPSGALPTSGGLFNAVRVTAKRNSDNQQGQAPSFFAKVMNHHGTDLTTVATAVLDDVFTRFVPPADPNSIGSLLPFTLDLQTWEDYKNNGPDAFSFSGGSVHGSADSTNEAKLYPHPAQPGNFGLVHIGDAGDFSGSGGANRLSGQIEDGISQDDLTDFHGDPFIDLFDGGGDVQGYTIDGDSGFVASLEDEMLARKGQVIAFFVHDSTVSQGTLANYHVVGIRFARIMDVRLTGGPNAAIWIQEEAFTGDEISGDGPPPGDGTGGSTNLEVAHLRLVQ